MIYLVSNQLELFASTKYKRMSVEDSIKMIESFNIIQFDTETAGLDPIVVKNILCAQFGNRAKDVQIVVDCTTVDLRKYKKVIEESYLLGQNLKFDIKFLFNYGIIPTKVFDIMVVEQLLYLGYPSRDKVGGIAYDLSSISYRYLGKYIDKSVRGEIIWRGLDESVILYAAYDVTPLEDIMDAQLKACKEKGCLVGAKLECDFVPAIAYLEWCGVKLDEDRWKVKMSYDQYIHDIFLKSLNDFVVASSTGKDSFVTYISYYGKEESDIIKEQEAILKYAKRREDLDITSDFGAYFEAYESPTVSLTRDRYVKINRQGDLFEGFDTEPRCIINWDSPIQVIKLAKELKFDTRMQDKKTGDDKDSVVEKHLKKQKGICDTFLQVYFNYKGAAKDVSTYGQSYINAINPKTGRIHTEFRQIGTTSSRMASGSTSINKDLAKLKGLPLTKSKSKKKGVSKECAYPQLQNLPVTEQTRSSFVSEKGNLMCSCDYSALESRLGAEIYQEQSMIEEFLHGSGDIHSLVAKSCFPELKDVSVKDIKKKFPKLRSKAKPIGFSQQFGGSKFAVANAMGCDLKEGGRIADAYNNGFPGIADFKKKGSRFVRNNGYILICKYTGHKLYWWDWEDWKETQRSFTSEFWDEYRVIKANNPHHPIVKKVSNHYKVSSKYDRLALNSPTQGTGIVILKEAMIQFFKWIIENEMFGKVLLCVLVHDEAVIEYPEELSDTANVLKKCMEDAAAKYCKSLPIPAEASIGTHWIH